MNSDLNRRAAVALVLLALAASAGPPAAAEEIEPGRLWFLRQYRVPGCQPMPPVPVVFNWLVRRALAIEEFVATSADCGQVGRRGAREGWTYIFWSEREDTAALRLLRRAQERFGVTQIVARKMDESFSIHGKGYEAFLLVQLGGDQGPVRIWAAGDVRRLEAELALGVPGALELRVESVTFDGRSCVGRRTLRPGEPGGLREALTCQGA